MKNPFKRVREDDDEFDMKVPHAASDKAIILFAAIVTLIGGFLIVSPPDFSVLDRVTIVPSKQQLEAQRPQEGRLPADEVLVPIYTPGQKQPAK